MKIEISTFHNSYNFGAALQAYALQQFLHKMGNSSQFVLINRKNGNQNIYKGKPLHACLNDIYFLLNKKSILRGKEYFDTFFVNYHNRSKEYASFEDLKNDPPIADVYLSGSDQVFNPRNLRRDFFLDYCPEGAKKISYAASLGVSGFGDKEELVAELLKDFSHISVREEKGKEALKGLYDGEITVNVDPTLLLTSEEWDAVRKPYNVRKPYILVYSIYNTPLLSKKLISFRKKTGFDVLVLSYGQIKKVYHNKIINDAGPSEFLDLVANAQMVVSSSFHGIVFSCIYKKPFYALADPEKPDRINNFLELFGLTERRLLTDTELDFDVDYSCFEQQVIKERERSKNYLSDALEV